jgi:oligosaccharide reducing-end xylanase
MIHKGEQPGSGDPMFHPVNRQILFVPGSPFTDPSYHLPHFYELIAERCYPEDREFMLSAAEASRGLIPLACHPETGLAPNFSSFEGAPWEIERHKLSHTHYSDSYRVALNIGLDALWNGESAKWRDIAEKLQRFYLGHPEAMADTVVTVDGKPFPEEIMHPLGLLATSAAISIARPVNKDSEELIRRFMEAEMRTDKRRYYDNCLYFFALLALAGRYAPV